jgi:hypothetical protein
MRMNRQCHLESKNTAAPMIMAECDEVDQQHCYVLQPLMKTVALCGMLQENSCVLFANISLCHELYCHVGIPASVPVVLANWTDVRCAAVLSGVTSASEERSTCPQNQVLQPPNNHQSSVGSKTGMTDLQIFLAFIDKI